MSPYLIPGTDLVATVQDHVVLDASVEKTSAPGAAKAYRAAREAFEREGHIPGARFADLLDRFSDPHGAFPFTRPDAARFEAAARELGVSNRDRLLIHDRGTGIWAARLWWLFRAFGHEDVAVLDGGLAAWVRAGGPLETGTRPCTPGDFTARERPGFFLDTPDVVDIVAGRRTARLVNALRRPVHSGHERAYGRAGHIPGSFNVPYAECLDPDGNTLLPAEALRARFAEALADPKPIVAYCGGGITAAGSALVLAILGHGDVAVYDGSLNAWAADPALPLVVDP